MALALVLTGIAIQDRMRPSHQDSTIAAPRPAPDYLATIRAPTPTPEPGSATDMPGERTTWVDDQDVELLTQWMVDSAWVQAVAIASGGDREGLRRALQPGVAAECEPGVINSIRQMVATGKMLGSTERIALAAGECIRSAAAQADGVAGAKIGRGEVARLLSAHSHGANPATTMTAAQPSPENMAFWRTVWPYQEDCRISATEQSGAIAASKDGKELETRLRAAFERIEACLTEGAEAILNESGQGYGRRE